MIHIIHTYIQKVRGGPQRGGVLKVKFTLVYFLYRYRELCIYLYTDKEPQPLPNVLTPIWTPLPPVNGTDP